MAEVESPVTRKGSKVGSGPPMSPGARSNPSRGPVSQDSVPPQPSSSTSRHSEPEPASMEVIGPAED